METVSLQPESKTASHDFDFEFGKWQVRHRRLRERLAGCEDWEEFTGTSDTRPVLGGNGNVEDNLLQLPSGPYRAVALRSFDVEDQTWAIWWLSAKDPHQLEVPLIGSFKNHIGTFLATDTLRGIPISVRFLWLRTDTDSPRWEQAMSKDDGATWETNWTMDFRHI